jgi:large subunit ribosomal protein L9
MASIKVLLKESIKHVGRVGDVVEVSPGYARNYLLPNDLAVEPTPNNVKKVEARKAEIERLEKERRAAQADLLKTLENVEVTLERRANEQGHLYGAVSATEIAKALQSMGHQVEPDDVLLSGKLDRIEKYSARISFADDLSTEIKVWVAPDAESKASIDAAQKAKAEAHAAEKAQQEKEERLAKAQQEKKQA